MSAPPLPDAAIGRWRPLVFLALCAAGVAAYRWGGGAGAEQVAIEWLTVRPAAALLDLLDPGLGVEAVGARLAAPGGGLHVRPGCEGADVLIMTGAAMMVAPLAWQWRVAGIVVGVLVIMALNWLRVMALFHLHRGQSAWFDIAHGLALPLAMVLAAGVFFVAWVACLAPRPR